jgi:hypothetical protein
MGSVQSLLLPRLDPTFIEAQVPAHLEVHLILGNFGTHKRP